MRICPDCQTEIADGKSFCPNCGKFMPLSAAVKPAAVPEIKEEPASPAYDWSGAPADTATETQEEEPAASVFGWNASSDPIASETQEEEPAPSVFGWNASQDYTTPEEEPAPSAFAWNASPDYTTPKMPAEEPAPSAFSWNASPDNAAPEMSEERTSSSSYGWNASSDYTTPEMSQERPAQSAFAWGASPDNAAPETKGHSLFKSKAAPKKEKNVSYASSGISSATPGVWSFVLTFFLLNIPVVGFVYFLALLFGKTDYPAKKNFARASLLFSVLMMVVASIGILIGFIFFKESALLYIENLPFMSLANSGNFF